MKDIFYLDPSNYVRDLDFLEAYKKDLAYGFHKTTQQPLDVCRSFVDRELRPGGKLDIKDTPIEALVKDENEDRYLTNTTFLRYLKTVQDNDLIISPSMTVYKNKKQEVAFTTIYLSEGIANRSKNKKAAFMAEERGDMATYEFKWNQQSVDKILNNGLSGAQCNEHTILYCPTIHSSLTSICRSAASYGNANNERILSGNRHYWAPEIVEANILATCRLIDKDALSSVMCAYGLHYPTPDDVMAMIERSTQFYFVHPKRMDDIRRLVTAIDPIDRAGVLYTSDLYHIAKHNEQVVRTMLDEMSRVEPPTQYVDIESAFNGLTDDMEVLVSYLCADHIRGRKLNSIKEMDTEVQQIVGSCAINVKKVVEKYADFYRVIFCSKVMPHSIANVPRMVRRVSVLSDTDSAIYTVQDWIEWFYGKITFDLKATNVGHCVSYITSTSIIHLLATMSKNMGVSDDELYKYTMKSEFYYPVFGLTSRAKTYYASVRGQEGLIFKKDKEEVKGAILKGSNMPKYIKENLNEMITRILTHVTEEKPISIIEEVTRVADLERVVTDRIRKGDMEILSKIEIKEENSYKLDRYRSNYFHYILWNEVFASKYGEFEAPPYRGVRLTLTTDTAAKVSKWVGSIEDKALGERLVALLHKADKRGGLGSIILPISAVQTIGIPIEIEQAMDIRGVLGSLMESHYVVLESLGYYLMDGNQERLLSDLY